MDNSPKMFLWVQDINMESNNLQVDLVDTAKGAIFKANCSKKGILKDMLWVLKKWVQLQFNNTEQIKIWPFVE